MRLLGWDIRDRNGDLCHVIILKLMPMGVGPKSSRLMGRSRWPGVCMPTKATLLKRSARLSEFPAEHCTAMSKEAGPIITTHGPFNSNNHPSNSDIHTFRSTCLYSFARSWLVDRVASFHAPLFPIEMHGDQPAWQAVFEPRLDLNINNLLVSMLLQVGHHIRFDPLRIVEVQVGFRRHKPETAAFPRTRHARKREVVSVAYKEAPFW